MENALAIFAIIGIIMGGAIIIEREERKSREKKEDDFFEEGSKKYDALQKEISKCKYPVNIWACEKQIANFIDNYYNHPCRAKYVTMLWQSLELKEGEIIRTKPALEYLSQLKVELS